MLPDFSYEKEAWDAGFGNVVGVDEVGRGAWAGPVVAGAVVFEKNTKYEYLNTKVKVDDSKRLSINEREKANEFIKSNCLACGIGSATAFTINKVGIVKATRIAVRMAVEGCRKKLLEDKVDFLLLDAFYIPRVRGVRRNRQLAIVKGDQKSVSIAAASIIAKVYRDRLMVSKSCQYGQYFWHKNVGYGTQQHREAILTHGKTKLHRDLFLRKLEQRGN